MGAAAGRRRGRLPLLEQRPGARLPRARGDPRRPRHGRHRPGDGLRQPQRRLRDRASSSPATRRPASRSSTATSCSTPRARTSSPAPTGPSRSRSSTSGCRTSAASCASTPTRLERHHRDLCDIEFTIEHGKLWMLQCRIGKRSPQAALRIAVDMAEDPDFPLTRAEAVRRVAGPPGRSADGRRPSAATPGRSWRRACPPRRAWPRGEIVTTPDAAVAAAEAGRTVILVRAETSPDDVHGMARGGRDPHRRPAASPATPPSSPAAGGSRPSSARRRSRSATAASPSAAGRSRSATTITIDGSTGEVFAGAVAGAATVVPEAATLLGLGAASSASRSATEAAGQPARDGRTRRRAGAGRRAGRRRHAADDVLRALVVKGYATPEAVATALLCTRRRGQRAPRPARRRRPGRDGRRLLPPHRRRQGRRPRSGSPPTASAGAPSNAGRRARRLPGPRPPDEGRPSPPGRCARSTAPQTFNDHSDAAYDARGPGRPGGAPRRRRRLAGAARRPACRASPPTASGWTAADAAARGGDQRYVASPRVDSYHGVWFELHEDLILLAGRNRADEVAAGRA